MQHIFENIGGEFVHSYTAFAQRLSHIKAFLFDWDGVFNAGIKSHQVGSLFCEPDSAGLNFMRFGHWLQHAQTQPLVGIITGAYNPTAFELAQREHFKVVYFRFSNKKEAFMHFCDTHQLAPHQVAFAFDDVFDLTVGSLCGLRFLVRRTSSPLFTQYVRQNHLADYITGNTGENGAVREISELVLATRNNFETVMQERITHSPKYVQYVEERNTITPTYFSWKKSGEVFAVENPEQLNLKL